MKLLFVGLPLALVLSGQDPNTVDQARDHLSRITPDRLTDPSDLSRLALRAPLLADPNVSLAELQSAQTALIRLADRLQQTEAITLNPPPAPFPTLPVLLPPPARRLPSPNNSPNLALAKPASQSSTRLYHARGAVDGRISGTPGFDTNLEPNPWWQVDLQQPSPLKEIRIYNSRINPERAQSLQVLLSLDGKSWTTAYAHNGKPLPIPLLVPLHQTTARFVRIRLTENNILHLDEVEIY